MCAAAQATNFNDRNGSVPIRAATGWPAFLTSGLLQRRIHPPLLRSGWSGASTYCQVRLRRPPGARLVLAASTTLRDDNW